jgi:acyl carrier protein
MVPASIVLLERMPRTPNGKVDRRALPIPDTVQPGSNTYCAPRTEIERRLAAIWGDVLNFERVSVLDNFFELGGHSLLATQLVSRIQAEFGQEMPVRTIFEAPTIATLALKVVQTATERRPRQGQQIGRLPRAAMASPEVAGPGAGT